MVRGRGEPTATADVRLLCSGRERVMTVPSEEEARAAGFATRESMARKAWEFYSTRDAAMTHDFRGGYHQGYIDGAASRVSTPPSEEVVDRAARAMYKITNLLSMSGARDLARAALKSIPPSEADTLEAFADRMANGVYLETGASEHHEAFNRAHMDAARQARAEAARLRGAVPAVPVLPTEPEGKEPLLSAVCEDAGHDECMMPGCSFDCHSAPTEPEEKR